MREFLENPLLWFCGLLSNILDPLIFGLFFVELGIMTVCFFHLHQRNSEICDLNGGSAKKRQNVQKLGRGKVSTTYLTTVEKDWTKFDEFRGKYQNGLALYNYFSLFIQLFPLLGILGTVAGLYISMNAHDGSESLYAGVGVALSTTVSGVFCAIFFKVFDVFLSNIVNAIDDNIDRYEKNYTVESQEAQGNISGSEASPTATAHTSARREQ